MPKKNQNNLLSHLNFCNYTTNTIKQFIDPKKQQNKNKIEILNPKPKFTTKKVTFKT
jgi:hypothetical protein